MPLRCREAPDRTGVLPRDDRSGDRRGGRDPARNRQDAAAFGAHQDPQGERAEGAVVNCPAVRDRLPEHALGIADHHDVHAVERHLAWCAACRKEARDLERAAATLAFAPAPAAPPRELEERIVAAARRDRPSVSVATATTTPS